MKKHWVSCLFFFILETILLGKAMKINPFNQPAVELIKKETKKILINFSTSKKILDKPYLRFSNISSFGVIFVLSFL